MPLVPFKDLMDEAERGQYAVGYFESWNLVSLLSVADAATAVRSPVILGFNGIYLPHPKRVVKDPLRVYAAMGLEVCRSLSVPACLVFNESPHFEWLLEAIALGFSLVMFTDETLGFEKQSQRVCEITKKAHQAGIAVEAEMTEVPGVGGDLLNPPDDLHLTDPAAARVFVEKTGIDALAVNIGQAHLHGRRKVHLNLSRLAELKEVVSVPLVLHGASSICDDDLAEAIRQGVRKINVGSVMKRTYFETIRRASAVVGDNYNPYEVVGSGLANDVEAKARLALQKIIEDLMRLFRSAGKA